MVREKTDWDLLLSVAVNIVLAIAGIFGKVIDHLDQSSPFYDPNNVTWVIVSIVILVVDAGVVSALMFADSQSVLIEIAFWTNVGLAVFGIVMMAIFIPALIWSLVWFPIADILNGLAMRFNAKEKA
jgi:hypothetical protein